MTISFLFWFCMFLWLLFGIGWQGYNAGVTPSGRIIVGGNLLIFLLLFFLGLQVFGWPIRG